MFPDDSSTEGGDIRDAWQDGPPASAGTGSRRQGPTLQLPADRARTLAATPVMDHVPLAFAPSLLAALDRLADDSDVIRQDVLLAAFGMVLARYSGHGEVAIAVPAGVVSADLSGDPTFSQAVARVSRAARDPVGHRLPPTERPDVTRPPRADSGGLFFPHLVVVGGDAAAVAIGYQLMVHLGPEGGDLWYDRQLFLPETSAGLADQLRRFLELGLADPDGPMSRLRLVTDSERRLLVDGWNDTALELPPAAIHELFEEQAARHPDAVAVGDGHGWLTYRQLNQRANQLARHLMDLGVGTESLVGICLDRTSAMVVAMLGVLKAGGGYVPLDPEYPAERVAFMLADTRAPVVITDAALLPRLPRHQAQVVCLDRDAGQLATRPNGNPAARARADNLAYVIYTSGSTGRPKGVMVEHRGIVSLVLWARATYSQRELDRVLASTSMCFDLSVFEIFVPLTTGTSLYLAEDLLDPGWAGSAPTLINTVPSVLAAMLGHQGLPESVVAVNLAGEPVSRDLVRATFAGSHAGRVLNLYGPSEATVYSTAAVIDRDSDQGVRIPIGRPVANAEIYLLDSRGQLVPRGAGGEIYIGGAGLARGYLNRPELTADRFVDHPFHPGARLYRSGDLGRYRVDGTIDFLGRVDHQVKIRGFRIEPGEIEATLLTLAGVAQAAVVIREDTPGQPRLVAYLVAATAGPNPPPAGHLRAYLSRSLPDYMIPAAFVYLDSMPRNPSGKLDRRALPAPAAGPVKGPSSAEPQTATEVLLAQIWADVLAVPKVGVEDDFFELGGHSLMAAEVVARVERTFRRRLPLTLVLRAANIRALAAALDAEDSGQLWQSVFPIRTAAGRAPLFCLHGLGGDVTGYRHLLPYLDRDQPLYGIQAVGLDGKQPPYNEVEAMAAHYISEIRTIQPEGPYLLAGICFGALVAYEMAHQLTICHRAGVGLVALIDPTPLPVRKLPEQLRRRVAKFRQVPRGGRASFLVETAGIVGSVAQQATWGLITRRRQSQHRPVPRRVLAMEAVNIRATQAYRPPPYGGPIVLYRSEGLATHDYEARALAWESLSGPNIDVVDVAGASHESLFTEPHVQVVAEHLRLSISRALLGAPGIR